MGQDPGLRRVPSPGFSSFEKLKSAIIGMRGSYCGFFPACANTTDVKK
jgi:hypothetical protein